MIEKTAVYIKLQKWEVQNNAKYVINKGSYA